VLDEDRSKGFILAVQNLVGVKEEILAGDVIHGAASPGLDRYIQMERRIVA
jgi:hypothetical protein